MIFNIDFNNKSLREIVANLENQELPDWMKHHLSFLKSYLVYDEFEIKTSGTTGQSKLILVSKMQMQYSAFGTLRHFKLQPGSTALLCLSSEYIAGKMMLVRAIIGKLNLSLLEPCADPSKYIKQKFDFTPLIPLQIKNLLQNYKEDYFTMILVGGGPVPSELKKLLQTRKVSAVESFAMTETLSHFALKTISPIEEKFFKTLPGFQIGCNADGELILFENDLTEVEISTHDLVEVLDKNHFIWKGRSDNLINSGGVKIIPEVVEEQISPFLPEKNFFIGSTPSEEFGEEVTLFVEGVKFEFDLTSLFALKKYHIPKKIIFIENFLRTETNKVKRKETIKYFLDEIS